MNDKEYKGHYRQHRIRVSLGNLNLFESRARPQELDGSASKAFAFRSRGRQGLLLRFDPRTRRLRRPLSAASLPAMASKKPGRGNAPFLATNQQPGHNKSGSHFVAT
jgi:hypothetical protein